MTNTEYNEMEKGDLCTLLLIVGANTTVISNEIYFTEGGDANEANQLILEEDSGCKVIIPLNQVEIEAVRGIHLINWIVKWKRNDYLLATPYREYHRKVAIREANKKLL